jgi:ABC-2 type transport system permease protein
VRLPRLFLGTLLVSVQRELAFRTDFVVRVLLTVLTAAGTVGTLAAVYSRVDSLRGWRYGDAIIVVGMFVMVNGVLQAFIEPNLEWFQGKVRNGVLDDILLKPAPGAFLASLATCRPFALVDVVIGAGIVAAGVNRVSTAVTFPGVAACGVFLAIGIVVSWAIRFVLASMAFWAGGLELTVLFSAPWQLGRYPTDIYGGRLRFFLTYVLPVAFVSTFPAHALSGRTSLSTLITGAVVAVLSAASALAVWHAGLRRYTSATS